MPEESSPHEGTWLQWPHHYQYGAGYRDRLDAAWVEMTKALADGEKVHIIAYDETEKDRITGLLADEGVSPLNINFMIYPTDDVWVRDNGPVFVKDRDGKLYITDWGFNGWGQKADYDLCDKIPALIAKDIDVPVVNPLIINEGGAVEIDGNGTLMTTRSVILNRNRNPGMTQKKAEGIFTEYLGATNFIWLDGEEGMDITDMHIDGFARFADSRTIVTMSRDDLSYWGVSGKDSETLFAAKDKDGAAYNFVALPLTGNDVITAYGKNLGYKGSYVNFYVANTVVLVPNYNDENDSVANELIGSLYPTKEVIGIDVRNLYENGGMVHCVTQQQPL